MAGLLSKQEFLRAIQDMDPYRFEKFIAEVWEQRGFETTVRAKNGDRGIDIIAKDGQQKHLLQVKRYNSSNKIGSEDVRKYATLYQQVEDADHVELVTSGNFSDQALQLAGDLSVGTTNGEELFEIVNSRAPDVAIDYLHSSNLGRRVESSSRSSLNTGSGESDPTVLSCPNCGETITDNKQSYIDHWADCELPDNRPSDIAVDTWWNIKDEVTEENETEKGDTPLPDNYRSRISNNQPTATDNVEQFIERHPNAVVAIIGLVLVVIGSQITSHTTGLIKGFFLLVAVSGSFLLFASYVSVKNDIDD